MKFSFSFFDFFQFLMFCRIHKLQYKFERGWNGDLPSNPCALMRNESLIVYLTRMSANGVFITRICAHWCATEIIVFLALVTANEFFITIFSLGLKKVFSATEWMKEFILSFWSYPFLSPISVETHVLIWVVRGGVENKCGGQMFPPLGNTFL